ncbi:Crp/Fnr family transcriptional regulator [Roseibacterium beibuensis]|uniref:Crp/Fnr family transcriptional regulator n=1 Tax=[Roseibacterium] beibuensis TaxID=1193142 RepID=UPI00217E14C8|nr:Crp/Fnr family transcriptional regulator [Roseibacterium beibuensis]MCS6627733.1 Crp/Fnr family transcriptional regulator [Roseibacterium beibuensis]
MAYGNHFLDTLEPDDAAALHPHLRRVEVEAGRVLIEQDSDIPEVHFPADAQLANLERFPDGWAIQTALIGREGLSGLAPFMAGLPCGWEVAVRTPGTIWVMPAKVLFERFLVSAPLLMKLCRLSYIYQMQAAQHAACNALHAALPRVARWLLTAADLTPGEPIRFTQEELAGLLGAQRTTINETANQLKDRGAIRHSRGVVRILDRGLLERLACDCYAMERGRIEGAGVMPEARPEG